MNHAELVCEFCGHREQVAQIDDSCVDMPCPSCNTSLLTEDELYLYRRQARWIRLASFVLRLLPGRAGVNVRFNGHSFRQS